MQKPVRVWKDGNGEVFLACYKASAKGYVFRKVENPAGEDPAKLAEKIQKKRSLFLDLALSGDVSTEGPEDGTILAEWYHY